MLSKESLEKFKSIYKKRFKKDLSDQEALEGATSLIRLVKLIYKPMTIEEYKMVQKRLAEINHL